MPRKPKQKSAVVPEPPKYPRVYEVWGEPYLGSALNRVEQPTDAVSGIIHIERYRITVERIEEPVEVLRARLKELWLVDERNSHHWYAFERVAKELGMDFRAELPYGLHGSKRKERK